MKKLFILVAVVFCIFSSTRLIAENNEADEVDGIIKAYTTRRSCQNVQNGVKTVLTVSQGSGPVIMNTLANGTGVLAGASTIGYCAGNGAADLLNKTVFSGDTKADEAARAGTKIGAAIGTAATTATLVSTGAGPVGLTAVGTALGGGMATGAIAVIAAPAAAAVAVGALFYWLVGD